MVDGARTWGRTAAAAVIASAGALALIAGAGAPLVSASTPATSQSPATLAALVKKAKAELASLGVQVQTARAAIASDQAQTAQETRRLANLVSAEYTGAPNGLVSVLASPNFSSALDTQIELSELTASQRDLLKRLAQNIRQEQASEAALQREQQQDSATEARLAAEELVAEFEAAQASNPPIVQGAPLAKASSPPAGAPSATPTPASTPTPSGPAPTATPPIPAGTGGPFSAKTNLTLPSGITLAQIQDFLQGTPLAADAGYFLQAEQTNHVSAIYLVADAVLETGWGTSALYTEKHNLFGFDAFDANPFVDGETFTSDQDCISYVSWFVSVYYLTPPGSQVPNYGGQAGTVAAGQYYNGPTPAGMNVDYASDPKWSAKIAGIGALLQSA